MRGFVLEGKGSGFFEVLAYELADDGGHGDVDDSADYSAFVEEGGYSGELDCHLVHEAVVERGFFAAVYFGETFLEEGLCCAVEGGTGVYEDVAEDGFVELVDGESDQVHDFVQFFLLPDEAQMTAMVSQEAEGVEQFSFFVGVGFGQFRVDVEDEGVEQMQSLLLRMLACDGEDEPQEGGVEVEGFFIEKGLIAFDAFDFVFDAEEGSVGVSELGRGKGVGFVDEEIGVA